MACMLKKKPLLTSPNDTLQAPHDISSKNITHHTQLHNVKKPSSLWNATFYTTSHPNEALNCESLR